MNLSEAISLLQFLPWKAQSHAVHCMSNCQQAFSKSPFSVSLSLHVLIKKSFGCRFLPHIQRKRKDFIAQLLQHTLVISLNIGPRMGHFKACIDSLYQNNTLPQLLFLYHLSLQLKIKVIHQLRFIEPDHCWSQHQQYCRKPLERGPCGKPLGTENGNDLPKSLRKLQK